MYPEQEKWVWSMEDTMEFWKHVKRDQKLIAGNHFLYKPTSIRAYSSNSMSMTLIPYMHRAVERWCHITTHSPSAQFPASLQVRSFTARESHIFTITVLYMYWITVIHLQDWVLREHKTRHQWLYIKPLHVTGIYCAPTVINTNFKNCNQLAVQYHVMF